jgi:hypothetical protein
MSNNPTQTVEFSNSLWLLEIIPPQAEDIEDIRGIPGA